MGIINVTPDSFSGDALGADLDSTLRQAESMVQAGADILDVGGESTQPGAADVTLDEELRRVVPVITALAARFEAPISVDTYKAEVADQAVAAGASIVNDVWAARREPGTAEVVARTGAWLILMHNRQAVPRSDHLGGHYPEVEYDDVVRDVTGWLEQAVGAAEAAGVKREKLIVDPGLGFGKTYRHNLELIRRLPELRAVDLPLLVGASRKSFTGRAQALPVDQRLFPSIAALCLCVAGGADIVRVHDVGPSVQAARMADEIVRPRSSP